MDITKEAAARRLNKTLEILDDSAGNELQDYKGIRKNGAHRFGTA